MTTIISNLMLELKAKNILTDNLNSLRLLCDLSSSPFCASNEDCWIGLLTKVCSMCLISITARVSSVQSVLSAGETCHPSWTLTEMNEAISLNPLTTSTHQPSQQDDILSSIFDDVDYDFSPLQKQKKPSDDEYSPISDDDEDEESNTNFTSKVSMRYIHDNSKTSKPTKHHREQTPEIHVPTKRKQQTRPTQHREQVKEIPDPTKRKQTRPKLPDNQKRSSKADMGVDIIEKIMASDNESRSGVVGDDENPYLNSSPSTSKSLRKPPPSPAPPPQSKRIPKKRKTDEQNNRGKFIEDATIIGESVDTTRKTTSINEPVVYSDDDNDAHGKSLSETFLSRCVFPHIENPNVQFFIRKRFDEVLQTYELRLQTGPQFQPHFMKLVKLHDATVKFRKVTDRKLDAIKHDMDSLHTSIDSFNDRITESRCIEAVKSFFNETLNPKCKMCGIHCLPLLKPTPTKQNQPQQQQSQRQQQLQTYRIPKLTKTHKRARLN